MESFENADSFSCREPPLGKTKIERHFPSCFPLKISLYIDTMRPFGKTVQIIGKKLDPVAKIEKKSTLSSLQALNPLWNASGIFVVMMMIENQTSLTSILTELRLRVLERGGKWAIRSASSDLGRLLANCWSCEHRPSLGSVTFVAPRLVSFPVTWVFLSRIKGLIFNSHCWHLWSKELIKPSAPVQCTIYLIDLETRWAHLSRHT